MRPGMGELGRWLEMEGDVEVRLPPLSRLNYPFAGEFGELHSVALSKPIPVRLLTEIR
jgi:hypothetical protein